MRLDQYLQKTGIVKRRSVAKELCDAGRVAVDGRSVKASHDVKSGEQLSVHFRDRRNHFHVKEIPAGNVKREDRDKYVELTAEELFHED